MDRQDLAEEIIRIRDEEGMDPKALAAQEFPLHPDYVYLGRAFEGVRLHGENWHQFARFALSPRGKWRYMYRRLAHLLNAHRGSYDDFFRLMVGLSTDVLSDRMSDLVRFRALYAEFLQIHTGIMRRVQVDRPPHERASGAIRGKINWPRTLRESRDPRLLEPVTRRRSREFVVPENVLLYLSMGWLRQEAAKLINTRFPEPLDAEELRRLQRVEGSTARLIRNFPYPQIRQSCRKFSRLAPSDAEISRLVEDAELRVRNGRVRNPGYADLLQWIKRLRELGLQTLAGRPARFHIDSMAHLDKIYEAWIFMELVEFCRNGKGLDVRLVFGDGRDRETFFEFEALGRKISVFYEKRFTVLEGGAWILMHVPDFSAFVDGRLAGVFDAKNYSTESNTQDGTNKMLSYMTNLDTDFGALFFPGVPTREPYVLNNARHHGRLTLAHYRMDPAESAGAIRAKNESLESLFSQILRRAGNPGASG